MHNISAFHLHFNNDIIFGTTFPLAIFTHIIFTADKFSVLEGCYIYFNVTWISIPTVVFADPDNFTPEEKSKDGLHIGGMSVCVICYAKFPNTAELLQHKQHHEASVPYCCSNCNEAFTTLPFLTEHKRIHSGEKPLDCQWCDRSFTTTRLLQEHRQTHFMAVYKCNDCANVFKSKRQLQIHHDKFHMSKPCFICEFCGKKFAYENKMKSHLDLHKQEDIFSHVTIEIDDQTGL